MRKNGRGLSRNQPTRPLPGGEQAFVRILSVPLLGGVRWVPSPPRPSSLGGRRGYSSIVHNKSSVEWRPVAAIPMTCLCLRLLFAAGDETITAAPGTKAPRVLNRDRSQSPCVAAPAPDLRARLAVRAHFSARRS